MSANVPPQWKVAAATVDEVVEALTSMGFYTEVTRLPRSGKIIRIVASKPRGIDDRVEDAKTEYLNRKGAGNPAHGTGDQF